MASHLSWFVNLLFLLLMLARAPTIDTRPASTAPTADLIAGNEFLKLFFERDETQRELHSGEYDENERGVRGMGVRAGSGHSGSSKSIGNPSRGTVRERRVTRADHYESTANPSTQLIGSGSSGAVARSLNYKSRNMQNEAIATTTTKPAAEESKQVVKLVTSGSKIVFLEEYDDNDAVVDAVARDIDLLKEKVSTQTNQTINGAATKQQVQMQHKSNPSDEVKVVAVSVSSSSKRGGFSRDANHYNTADTVMSKEGNRFSERRASLHQADIMRQQYKQTLVDSGDKIQNDDSMTAMKLTVTTTPPTAPMAASATSTMDEFVNRSHKSEFSIEEAEPLTMSPQQKQRGSSSHANSPRSLHTPHAVSGRAVKMAASMPDVVDSENSASTNIQNVLAAPLVQSVSPHTATASVSAAYHSGSGGSNRNSTSSHINHNSATATHSHAGSQISANVDMTDTVMLDTSAPAAVGDIAADVDDKLLPFQTVIYHNTKEGHGPQSRSISYSSLSQNVDDLHAWRHSGILAEAQRNVSESLMPLTHSQLAHTSEPAKFYSVPSKMYSEPSKFYSEPAKVYSEPAKVYGEPEKFYSEPAKVYGQPSKFYSEPAKVYSQPAKVYGEPAKTYWSPSASMPTVATPSTTTTSSTSTTTATSTSTIRPGRYMPSRRPAIVSRIAFGEAQTSTAATLAIDEHAPATMAAPANHHQQQQQHQQHHHHTQHQSHTGFHGHTHSDSAHSSHGSHASHGSVSHAQSQSHSHSPSQSHSATAAQPAQSQSQSQSHSMQSQPRRVLFNLDKLPYDLLNAPVQSSQHLLDPDFSHSPPAAVTYSSPRQRQCLESAFSASLSQSALQQQQQLQQQRQHSSLSDQHSNQNAKGLPNRDLVKCVSKYNQPLAIATTGATKNSHGDDNNDDNLFTPTPEQNYEIEESVSVMTNGRAHGIQGNLAATTTSKPFAMRTTKFVSRGGLHHQQHQQQHYHGKTNANANMDNNYDDNGGDPGGLDGGGDGGGFGEDGVDADGRKSGNDEDDDAKVAYVVEGRNYRKYRVEEKTDDGFIVGEYGVVDHNDGNLRGVRYTADSTINRSLIQKALLTFLKLK